MISSILRFFEDHFLVETEEVKTHGIEFATAALLIEVSRSDQLHLEVEQASIMASLRSLFDFY